MQIPRALPTSFHKHRNRQIIHGKALERDKDDRCPRGLETHTSAHNFRQSLDNVEDQKNNNLDQSSQLLHKRSIPFLPDDENSSQQKTRRKRTEQL